MSEGRPREEPGPTDFADPITSRELHRATVWVCVVVKVESSRMTVQTSPANSVVAVRFTTEATACCAPPAKFVCGRRLCHYAKTGH